MPVRQAHGEVRLAGIALRALGLLYLLAILAAAGCTYHDNRDAIRGAPKRAPAVRARAAGKTGVYHVVKKGENLYRIGKAYGVYHDTLARLNNIIDARDIRIGRRLFIPGATRTLPVQIITPIKEPPAAPARRRATSRAGVTAKTPAAGVAAGKPAPAKRARTAKPRPGTAAKRNPRAPSTAATRAKTGRRATPSSTQGFAWPVRGKITARFDPRHNTLNDGIDIAAPTGTPVRATQAGQVIYSDNLRGYGNLIIVRHQRGFASVYAHNRRNLVRPGQRVSRRQVIAEVGATGRVTSPLLHFEIRRNNVARDPLSYLP